MTVLDTTSVPGVRLLYRLALLLATISGVFCLIFLALLGVNYHGLHYPDSAMTAVEMAAIPPNTPSYRKPAEDSFNTLPTDQHTLLALRHALAQDKQNEELKAQIRQLDHHLRKDFFHRRAVILRTVCYLFISAILFFGAVQTIGVLKRRIPVPNEGNRQDEKTGSWHFAAVTSWLMLFVGFYVGLLLVPSSDVEQMFRKRAGDVSPPMSLNQPVHNQEVNAPYSRLTDEILAQNWVSFRNYDGNGVGFSDKPPIRWNGRTGENIVWQTEVPLPGNSSPIIWGNKLFLTGADDKKQMIFCFNIENGELLWEKDVTGGKQLSELNIKVDGDTGYAAPTPVVDGRHVYAMFANGELVAVDLNGTFVWRKSFGIPENHYGYASSPALYYDRLIVQFDDGLEENREYVRSKLYALDLSSGKVIWETMRGVPESWASPTIKKIGDSYQIITCANPFAIAYNPEDGTEIWRCKCLNGDVGPSAVALGDIVIITNESPQTTAIDATGSGDVTATHIRWRGVNATPDTVSPLIIEDYVLTLNSHGFLTGYNPKVVNPNNKRASYWELELEYPVSFYASPLRVGSYVYVFDKTKNNAKSFVIDLSNLALDDKGRLTEEAPSAMIISENPMPEPCVTSPAVLNNRLYIRGETTIYCIGEN